MFDHKIEILEYKESRDEYNDRTQELRHVATCYAQRTESGGRETSMPAVLSTKTRLSIPFATVRAYVQEWSSATTAHNNDHPVHEEGRRWRLHLKTQRRMLTLKVEGYKEAKAILDEHRIRCRNVCFAQHYARHQTMLQSAKSKVPTKSGTLKKQLRTVSFRDRNAPKSEVDVQ